MDEQQPALSEKKTLEPEISPQMVTEKVGHTQESKIPLVPNSPPTERIGQEQIHTLLFEDTLSWQAIIYDLINTEQLNPWDIDLSLLTHKFLERVAALEEANFFISSKVLLAASILLRIKSDILLQHDLASIDSILFGKKEEKKHEQERIELDETIPELVPRTPLSRHKKVTLQQLMQALGTAIKTENRRIRKAVVLRQYEKEAEAVMPTTTYNLRDTIADVYGHLHAVFKDQEERLAFSELLQQTGSDRVATFVSLLHLDNQHKVWLEQEGHFEEIWILLKELYESQNKEELDRIKAEIAALEVEHETEAEMLEED